MIDTLQDEALAFSERITVRSIALASMPGPFGLYRLRYSLLGHPYGATEAGLARFIVEQEVLQELAEGGRWIDDRRWN
jgi:hypothetical protein